MRFKLKWISALSALKMGCLCGGCVVTPFLGALLITTLIGFFSPANGITWAQGRNESMVAALLFMLELLVGASVFGGIGWMIGALAYNFFAVTLGGVEFKLVRVKRENSTTPPK